MIRSKIVSMARSTVCRTRSIPYPFTSRVPSYVAAAQQKRAPPPSRPLQVGEDPSANVKDQWCSLQTYSKAEPELHVG
jgi:hypothetical protein